MIDHCADGSSFSAVIQRSGVFEASRMLARKHSVIVYSPFASHAKAFLVMLTCTAKTVQVRLSSLSPNFASIIFTTRSSACQALSPIALALHVISAGNCKERASQKVS